ncbi:MAG TPA: hypothetical protein VMW48_14880, partial [Vicinamibacterales bacterium]|nr:hypothetical protein [Vicinamibacterales bacterium]
MAKVSTSNPSAGAAPSLVAVPPASDYTDWRQSLPTLASAAVTLREPVARDALPLLTALAPDALAEVVTDPPPATQEGFASLFASLAAKRAQGVEACWAVVPPGPDVPVGLILVRALDHGFTMVAG